GPNCRASSPVPGRSILITSAPRSPSIWADRGPASTRVRSRILMPESGRADIRFPPEWAWVARPMPAQNQPSGYTILACRALRLRHAGIRLPEAVRRGVTSSRPVPASGLAGTGDRSKQAAAVRHGDIGLEQHDIAFRVGKAEGEHFRHELADLTRREVDDGGDLPTDQGLGLVML